MPRSAASKAKRRQRRWPLIDQWVSVKSEAEPRSFLARQKLEYKAHGSLRGRNRKDTKMQFEQSATRVHARARVKSGRESESVSEVNRRS